MQYFLSVCASLAVSAVAQVQIAQFDFQDQLGTVQPGFASVSNVSLSKPHQFAGPANQRVLALPLSWNSGGTLHFTVTPHSGQTIDFGQLKWFVMPNPVGVADCVSAVTITANGVTVAYLNPIPLNSHYLIDLTGIPSLQNRTQPVTFTFAFVGNATGLSTHEIDYIRISGSACELSLVSVTPQSLPTVTADVFDVSGTGFLDAQGSSQVTNVTFGNTVLSPHVDGTFGPGTYEVLTACDMRIRPPQCMPSGSYPIAVTTTCATKTIQVTLTDPAAPTIAGATTHPSGVTQCISIHAGGAGPQVVLMFWSPSHTPSNFPGLVNLDIGANWSLFLMDIVVGDCGVFCIPVPNWKFDEFHYHQGVVWHSNNFNLASPMPTTLVLGTHYY